MNKEQAKNDVRQVLYDTRHRIRQELEPLTPYRIFVTVDFLYMLYDTQTGSWTGIYSILIEAPSLQLSYSDRDVSKAAEKVVRAFKELL